MAPEPNILVKVALFGWIPVVFFLFAVLPPRRAVLCAFLVAWLFLPIAGLRLSFLTDYSKMTATCAGVLLGTAVFDPDRFLRFRPHWADLPMLIWCFAPIGSSLDNGLGLYDGVSASVHQLVIWGIPYLIGRIYFDDWVAARELALAIFVGGLIYVPLCLYEIKMSPQLHAIVYGYHQTSFAEMHRFGGWRPAVFMQHGLMVGMWMTAASLMGIWLWGSGSVRRIRGWSLAPLVVLVLVTTVLCKSAGALLLLGAGIALFFMLRHLRTGVVVLVLAALPPAYIATRTVGGWKGAELLDAAAAISKERSASLRTRLLNEDLLAGKALQQPLFGWGGWGRNRVYDQETGEDRSITDGFWVIAFRRPRARRSRVDVRGVSPCRRCGCSGWRAAVTGPARSIGGAAALAVLLLLVAIDNVFNAMLNPVFLVAAGGLCGLHERVVARAPHVFASPGAEYGRFADVSRTGRDSNLVRLPVHQPMRTLIVIVNYRTGPLVIDCLRSLAPEIAAAAGTRVLVVDNDSRDGSAEHIRGAIAGAGWAGWAEVHSAPRNGGFAYGNNVGIRAGLAQPRPPDAFWLLNPDTLVQPGALRALTEFLDRHPAAGIVGSRLEDPDGTPECSAHRPPTLITEFDVGARIGVLTRWLARFKPVAAARGPRTALRVGLRREPAGPPRRAGRDWPARRRLFPVFRGSGLLHPGTPRRLGDLVRTGVAHRPSRGGSHRRARPPAEAGVLVRIAPPLLRPQSRLPLRGAGGSRPPHHRHRPRLALSPALRGFRPAIRRIFLADLVRHTGLLGRGAPAPGKDAG